MSTGPQMNGVDGPVMWRSPDGEQFQIRLQGRWLQINDGVWLHRDQISAVAAQVMASPLAGGRMIKKPNACVLFAGGMQVGLDVSPDAMLKWLDANP